MQFLRRRLSDGNFLAGGGAGGAGKPPPGGPAPPLLLVIGPPDTDWVQLFKGKSVHGDVELRVEQAQFAQLSLVASTHGGLSVAIGNRRFRPDFVLVREGPSGPDPGGAPQRLLAGLHMGGVPGTDPLPAARAMRDPRSACSQFAQLVKLQRELGAEEFPLVPQRFCTRPRGLLAAPTFPMTVTLSPAPPGAGQARVGSLEALRLVAAAMGGNRAGALVTMTPNGTQRVRVTRIGGTDRALSWSLAAGDPAGAGPQLQPMAVSARHRGWLDACTRLFGGLDICGVEALRGPDGREHILEVLGSWVPLEGPGAAQDRARIVELVLGRMRAELPPPPQVISGTPPEQRPPPQGAAPLLIGPAQPRPPPQGQPRPSGGVAPAGAAPARGPAQQPRPQTPPTAQPRPQTPPTGAQPRPQAPPTSPQRRPQAPPAVQPRPQTPPTAQPRPQTPPTAQPRPQAPPTSPQPRPQTPPTSPQPRPQGPPTGGQPRPPGAATSPQPRPQAPPTSQPRPPAPPTAAQPRPQAPPTGVQPRPPAPPTTAQLRPQAPPTAQPRPQAPPSAQPRPQAPPTAQPRPQAPPTAQPRPQAPPTAQPQPQAPPTSPQPRPPPAQPRPPGPQAPPTTRQPRPQAPPLAPKPPLTPKPGGAAQVPPSPAPSLRQSFASLFD